jgi:hypothetical protein
VVDVFEEVDEQLRSDHYRVLARRYLPWVGGVLLIALAVALGYWAYTRYQDTNAHKASEAYAQGMESLAKGDQGQAFNAFGDAAKTPAAGYKSLALMQQAAIRLDQKRTADAVALFDEAAKAAPDPALADAASLKAALALIDTAPYAQLETRLKPLSDAKRPYAPLAREALAVAKLLAGKASEARSDFLVLSLMASASDDVHTRAKTALALIDSGSLANLPAIVKAAAVLPRPAPAPEAGGPIPQGQAPDSQPQEAGAAQ